MATPTVSVIIAAYNAMPYLTRCLESVVEQTIGQSALEVIVVNDGSTDGTPDELERFAGLHPNLIRVFHQENSGGPSAPRNVGLGHARGEYVFFLDADDWLGTETLERMVAMSRENGTDIVLGKMVGVNGRGLPASMFKSTQPKTDVFHSRVYWALNPLKLFRRELIEKNNLRFPTGLPIGEDQPFTALAYLAAKGGISVIADYDCLFCTLRDDGGNTTSRTKGSEPRLRFLPTMIDLLLENVPPGRDRDHLAHRHLTIEVQNLLAHISREPAEEADKTLARLADTIEPLWHEGVNDHLSSMARLRLYLVRHKMLDESMELLRFERSLAKRKVSTPVLVENGRIYARYPFFRDPEHVVPDECYDITDAIGVRHHVSRAELVGSTLHLAGHGYLHRVETRDVTTELVLRERDTKVEYRLPVRHTETLGLGSDEDEGVYVYGNAGFEAAIDIDTAADGKPLADGLWDISLAIGAQSAVREVRIGSKRAKQLSGQPETQVVQTVKGSRAATVYTTKPYGNYTLDLGEQKHKVARHLLIDSARWSANDPSELVISGHSTLTAFPEGELTAVLTSDSGESAAFTAERTPHTELFTIRVQVGRLTPGLWTGELRLGTAWSVPLPPLPLTLEDAKWRKGGKPWYAKSIPSKGKPKRFALRVDKVDLVRAVIGRLSR